MTSINTNPQSSLKSDLKRYIFSFRSLVSREPGLKFLYLPYVLWDRRKFKTLGQNPDERVIAKDTQLVIDGFQGSANSFAAYVFQKSQSQPTRIAHHLHSPAQIIEAARQNIPILLVIRQPEKAILSLTSRWQYISVNQGLKGYVSFYSKLEPYIANCVVSTFEQTTKNYDHVIHKVNQKFATQFDVVDMEQANQWKPPQGERKSSKANKQQEFEYAENIQLLEQAQSIYQVFARAAEQN
ncbi:MAG: hypothetical protein AAFQ41_15340 [Cyanobacteria bacterium J06623_7]